MQKLLVLAEISQKSTRFDSKCQAPTRFQTISILWADFIAICLNICPNIPVCIVRKGVNLTCLLYASGQILLQTNTESAHVSEIRTVSKGDNQLRLLPVPGQIFY